MRTKEFKPFAKKDIALLHDDGFYLDKVPKKISGPEKVAQMCAIILVNRLNLHKEIRKLSNYGVIPVLVGLLVDSTKRLFENSGELDENLEELSIEEIVLNPTEKSVEIRLGVYTQAGEFAPLYLRTPLYGEGEVDFRLFLLS